MERALDISSRVDEAYDAENGREARAYIGASMVGNPCDAAVAFGWRGYPDATIDARLKRIFRDGHRIEDSVLRDLRKAGVHVMERDPMTGRQWRYEGYGGHVVGNADGLLEIGESGQVVGVEIKSMNDSKWKDFQSRGVKRSHPLYYDQMQFMMGLSELTRFVIVCYNKNTSAYAHEWVDFDPFRFASLEAKVERILAGGGQRVATDESDWRCKGCFKREACWHGALPEARTVRTCGRSRGCADGTFECDVCDGQTCTDWTPFTPQPRT